MFRRAAAYTMFMLGDALEIAGARLCGLAGLVLGETEIAEPWLYHGNGEIDVYLDGEPIATTSLN